MFFIIFNIFLYLLFLGFPGSSKGKASAYNAETWVQFLGREDHLEKEIATHSSTLAWRISWMEEPGRLQSMGAQGVSHNRVTSLSHFTFMHWRRQWQPTPVLLPGKSHGWRSLVGCSPWGHEVGHDWVTSLSLFIHYFTNLNYKKYQKSPIIRKMQIHTMKY